jgi:hypothetical protein
MGGVNAATCRIRARPSSSTIGNFANIDRALCTRDANGQCDTNEPILPKAASDGYVPIDPALAQCVEAWRADRDEKASAVGWKSHSPTKLWMVTLGRHSF